MAARKTKKTAPSPAVELVVTQLQTAEDAIDRAAMFLEDLGLDTQTEQLDGAAAVIQNVREVLEVLLGRVQLEGYPPAQAA